MGLKLYSGISIIYISQVLLQLGPRSPLRVCLDRQLGDLEHLVVQQVDDLGCLSIVRHVVHSFAGDLNQVEVLNVDSKLVLDLLHQLVGVALVDVLLLEELVKAQVHQDLDFEEVLDGVELLPAVEVDRAYDGPHRLAELVDSLVVVGQLADAVESRHVFHLVGNLLDLV